MTIYVILKPATIHGKRFAVGEQISDIDLGSMAGTLKRTGYIAELGKSPEQTTAKAKAGEEYTIPIVTKNSEMTVSVSESGIIKAFEILQSDAKKAVDCIAYITSNDLLILIDACDHRKSVKTAARNRAEELMEHGKDVQV